MSRSRVQISLHPLYNKEKKVRMMNTILFPSSYFDINKVDEDLEQEYQAALSTGFFNIVIFSYDKWFNDGVIKLNRVVEAMTLAVYRG